MGRKNKLQKFADLFSMPNVYENKDPNKPGLLDNFGLPLKLKGKWNSYHFKNDHPITLELACGKGDYTLGLAREFPNRNFIGVDIKGARIWVGAQAALDENLNNVAFLRTRIEQIATFLEPNEVEEIWITFPDPFLKKERRRLTSPNFFAVYRQFLKPGGIIHLKTDSEELYEFTLGVLSQEAETQLLYHDHDIYSKPLPNPALEFKTYYEKKHLENGKTIKYVKFKI